ncbi:cyclic nucleotide-binding domain-containing protein [Chloroflexota bacterium]
MIKEIIQVLRRCEVFVGLHDDDLTKIASLPSVHFKTYNDGDVISIEGEPAKDLFILVDGQVGLRLTVELVMESQAREIKVDTVNKGSIFGWSSLVQPYASSRTAVCTKPSKVLVINGKELTQLMDNEEHIGYEVMRSIACVIASRLRTPNNYFWAELLKARNGVDY